MVKKIITLLLLFSFFVSCNSYISQKDTFNNHLITRLAYEHISKKGLQKSVENHKTSELSKILTLIELLPVKFDPKTKYTHEYNEDGTISKTYLNDNTDYTLKYEYDRKKQILSMAGYVPGFVKEIIDYYPDGYIKYIFRETGEDIMYKYSKDFKTVSCFQFKPIKSGNKRAFKTEKLLYQMHLKNFENGNFEIQVIDADKAIEIEKYTYKQLKLVKKEISSGQVITYQYDDNENIILITTTFNSDKSLNYQFEYNYDDHANWTSRLIRLDNIQILNTERNLTYYN